MSDTPTPQPRDPRLIPLSHDHHTALARAREVVLALDQVNSSDVELNQLATRILAWVTADLSVHFDKEERWMVPPYIRHTGEDDPLITKMRRQHEAIRRLTDGLVDHSKGIVAARLRAWSTALSNHVRFEEREVFPAVQRVLTEDELETLGTALKDGNSPSCGT